LICLLRIDFGGKFPRFRLMTQYSSTKMEEDEDVSFSDYEIEDLFNTTPTESKGVRGNMNAKNDALDQSNESIGFESCSRVRI